MDTAQLPRGKDPRPRRRHAAAKIAGQSEPVHLWGPAKLTKSRIVSGTKTKIVRFLLSSSVEWEAVTPTRCSPSVATPGICRKAAAQRRTCGGSQAPGARRGHGDRGRFDEPARRGLQACQPEECALHRVVPALSRSAASASRCGERGSMEHLAPHRAAPLHCAHRRRQWEWRGGHLHGGHVECGLRRRTPLCPWLTSEPRCQGFPPELGVVTLPNTVTPSALESRQLPQAARWGKSGPAQPASNRTRHAPATRPLRAPYLKLRMLNPIGAVKAAEARGGSNSRCSRRCLHRFFDSLLRPALFSPLHGGTRCCDKSLAILILIALVPRPQL